MITCLILQSYLPIISSILKEREECNDTIYKVNFKFSLSSIFYIEEMLTIICNFSNGLYFVYLLAVDHSFHCNLDLETCPDLTNMS